MKVNVAHPSAKSAVTAQILAGSKIGALAGLLVGRKNTEVVGDIAGALVPLLAAFSGFAGMISGGPGFSGSSVASSEEDVNEPAC